MIFGSPFQPKLVYDSMSSHHFSNSSKPENLDLTFSMSGERREIKIRKKCFSSVEA